MKLRNRVRWFQPYDVHIGIETSSDETALEELDRILSDKKVQQRFRYSHSVKTLQEMVAILLLKTEEAKP